jgi:hypothetical protein
MNASPDTAVLFKPGESFCTAWLNHPAHPPRAQRTPLLARFLFSPGKLFIAGMASWGVLRLALDLCAWLSLPGLALCLTLAIVSLGFASGALSALDLQQPFSRQWRRLLAAVSSWGIFGVGCLCLF